MSDPYNNQYPNQYGNQQQQYNGGGYNNQHPPPQHQHYDPNYPSQNSGYSSPAPSEFGPPRRQDSYGPPAAGGFQHGYQGGQFGSYDASNPQGHAGYYQQQQQPQYPPQQQGYDPSNPQSQSQQQLQHYDQSSQYPSPAYQQQQQHSQYRDPNAPAGSDFNTGPEGAEGERGLGSTLIGGGMGYFLGHKKNHGVLGAIGGAIAANVIGSKIKDYQSHGSGSHHGGSHHGGSHHGGSHHGSGGGFGGSSWGGGRW